MFSDYATGNGKHHYSRCYFVRDKQNAIANAVEKYEMLLLRNQHALATLVTNAALLSGLVAGSLTPRAVIAYTIFLSLN